MTEDSKRDVEDLSLDVISLEFVPGRAGSRTAPSSSTPRLKSKAHNACE